jgi:hypothetical protein
VVIPGHNNSKNNHEISLRNSASSRLCVKHSLCLSSWQRTREENIKHNNPNPEFTVSGGHR